MLEDERIVFVVYVPALFRGAAARKERRQVLMNALQQFIAEVNAPHLNTIPLKFLDDVFSRLLNRIFGISDGV